GELDARAALELDVEEVEGRQQLDDQRRRDDREVLAVEVVRVDRHRRVQAFGVERDRDALDERLGDLEHDLELAGDVALLVDREIDRAAAEAPVVEDRAQAAALDGRAVERDHALDQLDRADLAARQLEPLLAVGQDVALRQIDLDQLIEEAQ